MSGEPTKTTAGPYFLILEYVKCFCIWGFGPFVSVIGFSWFKDFPNPPSVLFQLNFWGVITLFIARTRKDTQNISLSTMAR